MGDKLEELIKTLDTAVGMLLVPAMEESIVKKAMELVSKVSFELGNIVNEEEGE
ncbi:hypothetical protein [Clostridium tetani]|uniref:hypothetical protein n=1 Tax=Clostridium tetani TaxID=1513 RepID=UPI00167BA063|nr:hypothetical protein [Clostridium tetani]